MKFSVAPESTSAIASALLAMEWTKNRRVIDFRVDRYTSPLLLCLINADLIRLWENPHLLPFLWLRHSTLGPSCYSIVVYRGDCVPRDRFVFSFALVVGFEEVYTFLPLPPRAIPCKVTHLTTFKACSSWACHRGAIWGSIVLWPSSFA